MDAFDNLADAELCAETIREIYMYAKVVVLDAATGTQRITLPGNMAHRGTP